MIETGLRDKVALVTGGNHGIGAATASALAAQGAKVFIQYLRLPPSDEVGSELRTQDANQGDTGDSRTGWPGRSRGN